MDKSISPELRKHFSKRWTSLVFAHLGMLKDNQYQNSLTRMVMMSSPTEDEVTRLIGIDWTTTCNTLAVMITGERIAVEELNSLLVPTRPRFWGFPNMHCD